MDKRIIIITVDSQNGFVSFSKGGSLANKRAEEKIPSIVKYLEEMKDKAYLYFTADTHYKENYSETLEGKKLPVPHCLKNTWDWKIVDELQKFITYNNIIQKETFGYLKWKEKFEQDNIDMSKIEKIVVLGFCTDICDVSQCIILRAIFPNTIIEFRNDLSAGTSVENEEATLKVLNSCQIDVIR